MATARISPAQLDEGQVLSKAVLRVAEQLAIRNTALAEIIGVSAATVSRMKTQSYALEQASKPFELAVLLVRLFRGIDALMGGDRDAIHSWMVTRNIALQGTPISLIRTITGLAQTVQYVDAWRARI